MCQTAAQTIVHQFGFDSLTAAEGTCGSTTTDRQLLSRPPEDRPQIHTSERTEP